jgi:hypothetical protein
MRADAKSHAWFLIHRPRRQETSRAHFLPPGRGSTVSQQETPVQPNKRGENLMVAWSTVKVGDRLWEVRSERAGNTTMRRQAIRPVDIVEVHESHVIARWNGNSPRLYGRRYVEGLKRNEPAHKPDIFERAAKARAERDVGEIGNG